MLKVQCLELKQMVNFFFASAILLLSLAGVTAVNEAEARPGELPPCDNSTKVTTEAAKTSQGCRIKIEDLHPTQPTVGMLAVRCKAQKVSRKFKKGKLDDYLAKEDRFVPLVRGPGGAFYLTDHHHLATGIWNAEIPPQKMVVNAYLISDLSSLSPELFWSKMQADNRAWLRDSSGAAISPAQLPGSISQLTDDPLRTLSAWVRAGCGYIKCDPGSELSCSTKFPQVSCAKAFFLEFTWGEYLGSVPAVRKALADNIACPQQNLLSSSCLINQRNKLIQVLPATMEAAAASGAKTLGGYNPSVQPGTPEPADCASD
ncbi:MAG: ParB/Srx family N-terminal domain-containing protein [Cyanobacteriota bacterium]